MMRSFITRYGSPNGAFRLNCLAAGISGLAFCVLVLNFQATPAGAGADPLAFPAMPPLTAAPLAVNTPSETQTSAADSSGLATGSTPKADRDIGRQIQDAIHGSRLALQLHLTLLELGKNRMEAYADYTGTFVRHERLENGALQDMQTIQVKLRQKPFSVYLKWIEGGDRGREVLFVDGQSENKMLVKMGGLKGKLIPPLNIDPVGSVAMAESRYPVSDMGLSNLAGKLITYRKRDLQLKEGVHWEMLADQKICDRDCHAFIVEYGNRTVEPVYRKSIIFLDKEWLIPLCVKNFGWPAEGEVTTPSDLDEKTMIEYYGYKDIKFDQRLTDADFDRDTIKYSSKRK